jgi:hypothetical protein
VDGKLKLLVTEAISVPGPILEIGNTNSRYRFPLGARNFLNAWNNEGPAHHCAIGVGHVSSKCQIRPSVGNGMHRDRLIARSSTLAPGLSTDPLCRARIGLRKAKWHMCRTLQLPATREPTAETARKIAQSANRKWSSAPKPPG